MNHHFDHAGPILSSIDSDPNQSKTVNQTSHRGWRILLTGLAIFTAILLLLGGLLIQMFVVHKFHFTSGALVTSAPLGPTITIAHACSIVVSLTVPIVLSLTAYILSKDWLAASRTGGDNRPTPFQLGMLMNVLHGANLTALWEGCNFMFGFGSASKAQPLRRPRILRSAVAIAFFYLSLAYVCAICESWLSGTSEAVLFPQETAHEGSLPLLTRQLNQTLCDSTTNIPVNQPFPQFSPLCGMLNAGTSAYGQSLPEGLRTLNNASVLNSVAFADDQTALIAPATALIPDNANFVASAYGVRSTCQSITSQCINTKDTGPDAYLGLNCASSTIFNFSLPTTGTAAPFGVLNSSGIVLDLNSYDVSSNPFKFAAVLTSHAYTGTADAFVNNTGFFVHGESGAWNVLLCTVKVVSSTYRYTNGSFHTLTATTADLNMTKRIATMVSSGYLTDRVPNAVEGTGLLSGDYVSSFALELSRELAGMSASIYEPGAISDLVQLVPGIGAKLQIAPLVLLVAALLIYCLTTLPITVIAALGSFSTPYMTLARERLVDPLTVVHTAFDPMEVPRSWKDSSEKLFSSATEEDRLNIGPILTDEGSIAFGISRRRPI